MANKRIKKKQEKRTLQRQIQSNQRISEKELRKISYESLLSIAEEERKKEEKRRRKAEERRRKAEEKRKEEERKQKRRDSQKKYRESARRKRVAFIESFGIPREFYNAGEIDSIKMEDLNKGNLPIFFDKVYKFGNKGFYFAFRDYSWEHSFESIISLSRSLSDKELIRSIRDITSKRPTYDRKNGISSSGSAGDYRFMNADDDTIHSFSDDTNDLNKVAGDGWKHHKGTHKGFQELKSGGTTNIKESSIRNLLVIANAIMWNVTELDRQTFYSDFYDTICEAIPEASYVLPRP